MSEPDDNAGANHAGRKAFAEQFDKVVKPNLDMMARFVGFGVDYGKVALSHLFLINAGGLASVVALQPLIKDVSQLFLLDALGPAIAFGLGLALATAAAASSFYNQTMHGLQFGTIAFEDELWLRHYYLKADGSKIEKDAAHQATMLSSLEALSSWFYRITIGAGLASGFCAAGGGVWLAYKMSLLTLR